MPGIGSAQHLRGRLFVYHHIKARDFINHLVFPVKHGHINGSNSLLAFFAEINAWRGFTISDLYSGGYFHLQRNSLDILYFNTRGVIRII
ncbi:hypothetical protein D3C87_1554820 [compost metagenome]